MQTHPTCIQTNATWSFIWWLKNFQCVSHGRSNNEWSAPRQEKLMAYAWGEWLNDPTSRLRQHKRARAVNMQWQFLYDSILGVSKKLGQWLEASWNGAGAQYPCPHQELVGMVINKTSQGRAISFTTLIQWRVTAKSETAVKVFEIWTEYMLSKSWHSKHFQNVWWFQASGMAKADVPELLSGQGRSCSNGGAAYITREKATKLQNLQLRCNKRTRWAR